MGTIRTGWIDWASQEENWLYLPGGNEPRGIADEEWMSECIRSGSRRLGDYTIQETLGGPWGTDALDCAIAHAMNGDDNDGDPLTWEGICPEMGTGLADLQIVGNSAVTAYGYSDVPGGLPFGADVAHVGIRTIAYGIWLIPLKLNLPPRGVLPIPDPEADGLTPEEAATADIEFESETVQLAALEITDAHTEFDADPESYYAVNYMGPTFEAGTWGSWPKGGLPGVPPPPPAWVDGPEDYTALFPSEAAAWNVKDWYPLDIPADGFESLTQDHLNDTYDYLVTAGPQEAFGLREFTDDRLASTSLILKAYVTSPRYRWVYEGQTGTPPRRIVGRPSAARIFGDNTVQNGRRAGTSGGGIL